MSRSAKEALMGKTITDVTLDVDNQGITFHTTDGPVRMVTEGDCCSFTWIESLDDPDALLGTVTDVEDLEVPDLGNITTEVFKSLHGDEEWWTVDEVSYYGMKITTNRGRCVIDYRNDSNGYYGGDLRVVAPGEWGYR